MPFGLFQPDSPYLWDRILSDLATFGYRRQKLGALELTADPTMPVFVFPTEGHDRYTNAHQPEERLVQMEVNPACEDINVRLRGSATGIEVGLFYRARGQTPFTFLGPARFVGAADMFYRFRYPAF
jgi:hypothetical protein